MDEACSILYAVLVLYFVAVLGQVGQECKYGSIGGDFHELGGYLARVHSLEGPLQCWVVGGSIAVPP